MSKYISFFIALFISVVAYSQQKYDSIPKSEQKLIETLLPNIINITDSEEEKVKGIYDWVIHNISYDYDRIKSGKPFKIESSKEILKNKKTICTGYATLMQAMLKKAGINSEIISGYSPPVGVDSIDVLTEAKHAWLSVKIDGIWRLTDPTWGAGNVGNIPTDKEEKFAKKKKGIEDKYLRANTKLEEKINEITKEKKINKAKKKLEKLDEKNKIALKKYKEAYEKAPDYTGKIGFVKEPNYNYHLVHPDSFLLTHLPINPMWQLRNDTVGITDFIASDEKLKQRFLDKRDVNYNFEEMIHNYRNLNYIEKLIWSADDGFKYNPNNYFLKVINYYNYVNILTDKEIQKKLPDEADYKIGNSSIINNKIDTINKYIKLAKKASKMNYKYSKNHTIKLNKADVSRYKMVSKTLTKSEKNHNKVVDNIEKNNSIFSNKINSFEDKKEKLETVVYRVDKKFNLKKIPEVADSIKIAKDNLKIEIDKWEGLVEETLLQPMIDTLYYINYLFKVRNKYLSFQNYITNRYTEEIDLLIDQNFNSLYTYYKDSIEIEIFSKKIIKKMNAISSLGNYAKIVLVKKKILEIDDYKNYFNNLSLTAYKDNIEILEKAITHNNWMKDILLKDFNAIWKELAVELKTHEKLNKKRFKTSIDDIENENKRSDNTYQLISGEIDKWEEKY